MQTPLSRHRRAWLYVLASLIATVAVEPLLAADEAAVVIEALSPAGEIKDETPIEVSSERQPVRLPREAREPDVRDGARRRERS